MTTSPKLKKRSPSIHSSFFRRIWASFWLGSSIRRNGGVIIVCSILFLMTFYRDVLFNTSGRPGVLSNLSSVFGKSFTASGPDFLLNGEKFQILSGAIHYFRVPPEYWRDRLRKLKACGLNTVDTYVPWNLHEETAGNFSFSAHLDLERFLRIAQEEKLYVILRPGPYICAEWDLGGLPAWLLRDSKMQLRTTYQGYLDAVEKYFKVLIPKILPYQLSRGGPILMVQIENEYGSYRQDQKYVVWLRDLLVSLGIKELLFTSDGFTDGRMTSGSVEGELAVVNDRDNVGEALTMLKKFQPDRPLMMGEFWSGWFDHWSEKHHTRAMKLYLDSLAVILGRGASLNLYMFHGGTNFNFWNGANIFYQGWKPPGKYKPTITSYDYDAPVSESGELTKKYMATCQAIEEQTKTGYKFDPNKISPLKTALPPPKTYGKFPVKSFMPLTPALRHVTPWTISKLVPMEQVCDALTHESSGNSCRGQNFGFIAYRTQAPAAAVDLHIKIKIADRAQIIIDKRVVATVESFTEGQETELQFKLSRQQANDLVILVENMGRINYANYPFKPMDSQRKGILNGSIKLEGKDVQEWQVYMLEMKSDFIRAISGDTQKWADLSDKNSVIEEPGFYRVPLNEMDLTNTENSFQYPSDTFLNFENWNKGAVFINGFNLGRYWREGPQRTLFVPGPRLAGTQKELIMFELQSGHTSVKFQSQPLLN